MNVKLKKEDKKTIVAISGKVDTNTAPELLDFLKGAMPGVEELVLDFKDLEYISSAGLRVVLFAQKTMNAQGSMVVANVNDDIMETFELTGFLDILTIV